MNDQIAAGASAWLMDSEFVTRELGTDASGFDECRGDVTPRHCWPQPTEVEARVPAWRKLLAVPMADQPVRGCDFDPHQHPVTSVEAKIADAGLDSAYSNSSVVWHGMLFERV
ncbi:MAG TPA: hypothetical protein VHM29_01390 [Acidimicrobiia bacterium]|nr:hypothetical protein [Acidimicrobiia bacterium]